MRNRWIVVSAFSLISAHSAFGVLRVGAQAGINLANAGLSPTSAFAVNNKSGLMLGALLELDFGGTFSLQPGLHYIQKGYKQTILVEEITTAANYIEIPVLLKAAIGLPLIKPFFFAGPKFGFLMSASSNGNDAKGAFASTDLGIVGGAGVELPILPMGGIFISAGYSLGLKDVSISANDSVKNKGIEIQAGFLVGI